MTLRRTLQYKQYKRIISKELKNIKLKTQETAAFKNSYEFKKKILLSQFIKNSKYFNNTV